MYRNYSDSSSGVYPDINFEGMLLETWPGGSLKYRGEFRKGRMRIGQHMSFWQSGALQEISYWRDGWVCGTLIFFRSDGTKEFEKDFGETGGKRRFWTKRNFGLDGDLVGINVYKDQVIVAQWDTPEMDQLKEEIGFDEIMKQAVRRAFGDQS